MKKIIYLLTITVLLSACTELLDPSQDVDLDENEFGNIYSTVVINGEPVNGAAVLLTPGGGTKITGSDGMCNFLDLEPGRYELKVYKEGVHSFNKSINVVAGKNEDLTITLTKSTGKLSINKAYIDMGSNESNNLAGFTILNSGDSELSWRITNAAGWITQIDPKEGVVSSNSSEAVTFAIDRSKLSANTEDNYASLIVRSTNAGDGSVAELLVTVFGIGDGVNTTITNSDDYIIIGDLYVQTKDIGGRVNWSSANNLCQNSIVGNFNDWRLPTIDELATIYTIKEAIGGFNEDYPYWSSTDHGSYYYYLYFSDGSQASYLNGSYKTSFPLYCRAVRKNVESEVAILPVSNISESAVTFNGEIKVAGNPAYTERGFVYATSHLPTVANTKIISYTPSSSSVFNETVAGLTMGATYYVRAYATNSLATVYSEEIAVTISNQLAQVSTLPVSEIAATSVVFHGNVESKGIPAYTERGFVYSSTFMKPTINNSRTKVLGTGIGAFSANISGLTMGTTYYVRAYATNSEGTAYGESISFTPESPLYTIIGGLMVQKQDITNGGINWTSAKSLCENSIVGGYTDWRMPTLNELTMMYSNREKIGGFNTSAYYWCSTLLEGSYYYVIRFTSGGQYCSLCTGTYYCRAVRTIK